MHAVLAPGISHCVVPPLDTTLNYFYLQMQHDTNDWFSDTAI